MAPRTGRQRETIEACKHCEHNGASCDTDHNRSHLPPDHPALPNLLAPPVPRAKPPQTQMLPRTDAIYASLPIVPTSKRAQIAPCTPSHGRPRMLPGPP